jgi:hypothetical protein
MDDDQKGNGPGNNNTQEGYSSRREARWRRIEERRAARRGRYGSRWIGGAVLIALGIILLLSSLGSFYLENWWALFILIPAIGAFGNAWRTYQAEGHRLTAPARGSLIGGSILLLITAIFLFNLNWALLGPIILIVIGLTLLLNFMIPG